MRKRKVLLVFVAAAFLAAFTPALAAPPFTPPSPASPTVPASAPAADERYIVQFHPSASDHAAEVRRAGGSVVLDLPEYSALAARLPQQALEALQHNPHVASVEVDPERVPMGATDTVLPSGEILPYGIQMVQAEQLSSASAGNRKVCVIDTGYSMQHADLPHANVTASVVSDTGDPFVDGMAHGTHVAGTLAAIGGNGIGVVGVLPGGNAQLHIVKVFSDAGVASYASTLADAVTKCRNAGANIINMSIGGSGPSSLEQYVLDAANTAGVLLIAAAGNGSTSVAYPAGYASVVSVGAVDQNMTVASGSPQNADVELAAPGVVVRSTVPYLDTNRVVVTQTDGRGVPYDGWYMYDAVRTPASGVSGTLVAGGRCPPPTTSPDPTWNGNVVLCERGDYNFVDIVKQVQSGGGVAALVYNNVPGDFQAGLGTNNGTFIPAVSFSQAAGQALIAQLGQPATVVSTYEKPASGYHADDGTSMAAPHVAGVAALVWSYNPAWTNAQIRTALQRSARDLGVAGRDAAFGFGLVQAKAACDYLGCTTGGTPPATPTPPPPPTAPSGLTATPASSSQITLAWVDTASNEDSFAIERCQGTGCTSFAPIGTVGANITTFSNSTLNAATTYVYRVRATGAGGASAYSNTATATTQAAVTLVAPGGLSATATSNSQITLKWTDTSTGEAGFKIERCRVSSSCTFAQIATVSGNVSSFLDTGLSRNTTYRYRVRAYAGASHSAYSATVSATTLR